MTAPLVISLSSVPPRFGRIGATLRSLLAQRAKVQRILLCIPRAYRRFPDWDGTLPQVPEGVEILRCDEDLGPATKVLAPARALAGQGVRLLYCDDDRAYVPDWAERLLAAAEAHPDTAVCGLGMEAQWLSPGPEARTHQPRAVRRWRMTDLDFQLRYLWQDLRAGRHRRNLPAPMRRITRRAGYIDIAEGAGGVLVRPEWYDDSFRQIPPLLWGVDDIWLSGKLAAKGIPIWLLANLREPDDTEAEVLDPLWRATVDGVTRGAGNSEGVDYMRRHHGVWT